MAGLPPDQQWFDELLSRLNAVETHITRLDSALARAEAALQRIKDKTHGS